MSFLLFPNLHIFENLLGTTWHTAGLVWRLRPNDTDIQLHHHMNNLVNSIEEETGINPGWINNGGLFIANNKVRQCG